MKKTGKVMMILGLALIFVGGALFVGVFAFNGFDLDAFARNVSYKRVDYTLEDEFDCLKIQDIDADIHILPGTDDACSILYDANNRQSYIIEVADGTLEVSKSFNWMDCVNVNLTEPELTIYLPVRKYVSLCVETVSGDVRLEKVGAGDVKISSVSGDVRIDALEADQLSVNSTSGDAAIENSVVAASADIHTVSGDILRKNSIASPFQCKSVSGEIIDA